MYFDSDGPFELFVIALFPTSEGYRERLQSVPIHPNTVEDADLMLGELKRQCEEDRERGMVCGRRVTAFYMPLRCNRPCKMFKHEQLIASTPIKSFILDPEFIRARLESIYSQL